MRNTLVVSLAIFYAVGLTGCTASQSELQKAQNLDNSIAEFRNTESQRIDKLNQDYREAYDQLITTLESLGDAQLVFDRGQDAQTFSDSIIGSLDNATLPGQFSRSLLATVQSERAQLLAVDNQMQQARDQYAAAYKNLQLTLNKLDDLRAQLKILYTPDTPNDKVTLVVNDVQAAYNGIKTAAQNSNTGTASN